MKKLCFGSVFKILSYCKIRCADLDLAYKLFNIYDSVDSGLVGNLKVCKKNLPDSVFNHYKIQKLEDTKLELLENAENTRTDCLRQEGLKQVILSIVDIIRNDDSIEPGSVIGYDPQYKKMRLVNESHFRFDDFLANILYYTFTALENKDGADYINGVNEEYFKSFEGLKSTITLLTETTPEPNPEIISKVDISHPFRYNSNTTTLYGRNKEMHILQRFVEHNNAEPIKWIALTGPGGSGKSKLAHCFAATLNQDAWDIITFDRNVPFTYEQLTVEVPIREKNILLIVDNDAPDSTPLAKWMSRQFNKNILTDIRIIICQRIPASNDAKFNAPWFDSLISVDENSKNFVYKSENVKYELPMLPLSPQELGQIAKSYFTKTLSEKKSTDEIISAILTKLDKIDHSYHRPLFLLLLCDAFINGKLEDIHNTDRLLDYAYNIEKRILHNRIYNAFKFTNTENKQLYHSIEMAYTYAIIDNFGGHTTTLPNITDLVNTPEKIIPEVCDTFGITVNGSIPVIEPDLLAEYFVLRHLKDLHSVLSNEKFWIPFFRDFNYILTTYYLEDMKAFFSFGTFLLALNPYFLQGIFQAFCITNDNEERQRLYDMMSSYISDLYEWLNDDEADPFINPGNGLIMIMPMLSKDIEMYQRKMQLIMSGQMTVKSVPNYGPYDLLLNQTADMLCQGILHEAQTNPEDVEPLIKNFNDLIELYQKNEERQTEIPEQLSEAFMITAFAFLGRGFEYSDEITGSFIKNCLPLLIHIHEKNPGGIETLNYMKTLMIFFTCDDNDLYLSKDELLNKIIELYEKYGTEDEVYKVVFYSFLIQCNLIDPNKE